MNKDYITAIKENVRFQVSDEIEIEYNMQEPQYGKLEAQYQLSSIAAGRNLDKAVQLLSWVNGHIRHIGNYDNSDSQDALTLLEIAFDKDYGINCLSMSIILCECLLAVSVKARVMYMMPKAVEDGDNHVVVEAFIPEFNKWILLDPTYGCYCMDAEGNILNLYEIRNCIADDQSYYFSKGMNYNGKSVDDLEDVRDYYAKNLFFLRCRSVQGYGQHREYGNMVEMAPVGFDVHKRMIENLKYRIRTYGDFEPFRVWMQYEERLDNQYIDINSIY